MSSKSQTVNQKKMCEDFVRDNSSTEVVHVEPQIIDFQEEAIEDHCQKRNEVKVINRNRITFD